MLLFDGDLRVVSATRSFLTGFDLGVAQVEGRLLADIGAEGEYQAMMALFNGERRARGVEAQAAATENEGRAGVFGSILEAGGKMFAEKYGGNFGGGSKSSTSIPSGGGSGYRPNRGPI